MKDFDDIKMHGATIKIIYKDVYGGSNIYIYGAKEKSGAKESG